MPEDDAIPKNGPPPHEDSQWEEQLADAQTRAADQTVELAVERASDAKLTADWKQALTATHRVADELAAARGLAVRIETFLATRSETKQLVADLAADDAEQSARLADLEECRTEHSRLLATLETAHKETLGVVDTLEWLSVP